MRPEEFQRRFTVSDEAFSRLQKYHELLVKWQKAINLVSPKTVDHAWQRHFADSAQLIKFLPPDIKVVADLGSGAGFPGLALAILRPELEIHLVESDQRKSQFLKTVSRETGASVVIHNERVEKTLSTVPADLITARAFASLKEILQFAEANSLVNPALQLLLLKGKAADVEISEASDVFEFKVESHPSVTEECGQILKISDLRRR